MSFMHVDDSCLDDLDAEGIKGEGKKKRFRKRRTGVNESCRKLERLLGKAPNFDRTRFEDIRDFWHRFQYRRRLLPGTRELMEVAAAKLCWDRSDGEPGYFQNALVHGVPMDQFYSILASIGPPFEAQTHLDLRAALDASGLPLRLSYAMQPWYEKVIRCGIYTATGGVRNSGRCHLTDVCNLCCWLDYARPLVDALDAACFRRVPYWYFATISFTSDRSRARAVGRDITDEDFDLSDDGVYAGAFSPRPLKMYYDDTSTPEIVPVPTRMRCPRSGHRPVSRKLSRSFRHSGESVARAETMSTRPQAGPTSKLLKDVFAGHQSP